MIYSTKQFLLEVNGVQHMENQVLRIWHGGGPPKQMGKIYFTNFQSIFQHMTRYGVRADRKTRLVFAGPVRWTAKKTEIELNPTAKDRTTSCSCTNSEFFRLPVARFVEKSSTLQCPSHSCRNPQESTGILRNGTGILRNGTGIELKSSGMRLEHYVYMQIYVYKHLYVNIYNRYNIFSFCWIHLH